MIVDMLTVMWKEGKSLIHRQGGRTRAVLSLLVPAVGLGIYLPLQIGRALVEGPWSLIISVFVPMMVVGMTIPESFAGERERHTLETLLASRLPDRAILFGKLAAAVVYAWGMALSLLLVSLVAVNLFHWNGAVLLYPPVVAFANVALSLLIAGFEATLGVLISLRAATVQQAQQRLMASTLFPLVLLQTVPLFLLNVVPDGRVILGELISTADPTQILLVVIVVLATADLGLLVTAMVRFKRARLIEDG
jgi:ABC-2 type transport system permease protein